MRAIALGLALLAAVAGSRSVSAAAVALDFVVEHQALEAGDRDVWGLWLRTTSDVQVSRLYAFVNANPAYIESLAIDVSNPAIDISSITSDALGDSIPLLIAEAAWPAPLVGPGASGRIATLTGRPLEGPPHVFLIPELIPFEQVYGAPSIDPTNSSGSPLSVLLLSGPYPPYCDIQACEIPLAPNTVVRWLWELPEPRVHAALAAVLLVLALRRRA